MKKDKHFLALIASNRTADLLAAGYSASALLAAGYSLSDLLAAGYSASALRDETPLVERPYSRLLTDIREKKRLFRQSTFGPDNQPKEVNICDTAMCTAGHLVNMAGEAGWKLKEKYGYSFAAALIHEKAHPGWPCPNFGAIPDEWALAYIEEMAEREEKEANA